MNRLTAELLRPLAAAAEAIARPRDTIDLAHSRLDMAPSANARRAKMLAAIGLAAAALLLLPYVALWHGSRRLASIEAQIRRLEPTSGRASRLRDGLKFYEAWRSKRPKWLEVIRVLSAEDVMPYGVYVVSVSFSETKTRRGKRKGAGKAAFEVKILGRTNDANLVHATLIPKLSASPIFSNVTLETMGPPASDKGREFRVRAGVRTHALTTPDGT